MIATITITAAIITTIAKIIIIFIQIIIITVTSLEIPAVWEPEKQVETLQLSPRPASTFNCHFLLHLWMCHSVILPFSTPVFLCFSICVFQRSWLKFCRRPCRLQLELGISICICDSRRSSFRATRNVKVLLIFWRNFLIGQTLAGWGILTFADVSWKSKQGWVLQFWLQAPSRLLFF